MDGKGEGAVQGALPTLPGGWYENDRYKRMERIMKSVLIIMMAVAMVSGLELSKDTINAYDGRLWGGREVDSIDVINNSNRTIVIDSIFIEFDTSGYDSFEIGWEERPSQTKNFSYTFIKFHKDVFNPSQGSIDLTEYNSGKSPRLTFSPRQKKTWFPPYFSKYLSEVGMIVDIFGPLPSPMTYHYFPGRIILISNHHRDTINLACELMIWPTHTVSLRKTYRTSVSTQSRPSTITLTGRTCQQHKSTPGIYIRHSPSPSSTTRKNHATIHTP